MTEEEMNEIKNFCKLMFHTERAERTLNKTNFKKYLKKKDKEVQEFYQLWSEAKKEESREFRKYKKQ